MKYRPSEDQWVLNGKVVEVAGRSRDEIRLGSVCIRFNIQVLKLLCYFTGFPDDADTLGANVGNQLML
jgi:hypothetical protein